LEGLAAEYVCLFYGYLVYSTAVWYVLWPFRILYGYLVYFFRFGMFDQQKSGNLASHGDSSCRGQQSYPPTNASLNEYAHGAVTLAWKAGLPDFLGTTYQNGEKITK
jgi:hypothetical protein